MAPVLAQRSMSPATSVRDASSDRGGSFEGRGSAPAPAKKKGKKKKKGKLANADRAGAGEVGMGPSPALPLEEGGMVYGFEQQDQDATAYAAHRGAKGWIPHPVGNAPQCCPPDRCTGDKANYAIWPQLDGLLYETCLAGFKCESLPCSAAPRASLRRFILPPLADELIDNLAAPLEYIRDQLAKTYLSMGGLMTIEGGAVKDMSSFVRLAEKGMWSAVTHLEVQDFTQRTLAVSLQKLMEVFVSRLAGSPSTAFVSLTSPDT